MRYSQPIHLVCTAIVCLIFSGCGGSSGSSSTGGGSNNQPATVTFSVTGATPIAVQTKVGSGNFTPATISSNTVTLSIPSGTRNFAVAWVCPPFGASPATTQQNLLESTTDDGITYTLNCVLPLSAGTTGTLTMSIDASAFSATTSPVPNFVQVDVENGSNIAEQFPSTLVANSYGVTAPAGSDQVNLSVHGISVSNGFGNEYLIAAKSFSGVSVPGTLNNGSTVTFTSADAAVQQPITYSNVPAGYAAPTSTVDVVPSGETSGFFLTSNATSTYPALPATIAKSTDRYVVVASALSSVGSGSSTVYQYVAEFETFNGEGPVTVAFPTPWSYTGPTPASLPTMNINYTGFSGQSGVSDSGNLQWISPSDANAMYIYHVTASAKYLGGSTSLQFPDLSSLTGFFPGPATGTSVNWEADAYQNSAGIAPPALTSGNELAVAALGTYTAP